MTTKAKVVCVTPGCGYSEEINLSDVKDMIGYKCPSCNATLITNNDHIRVIEYLANAQAGVFIESIIKDNNTSESKED